MNATIEAAIAAELAVLAHEVDAPATPLGYGTDLSCVYDLDPQLAEVDPRTPRALSEAILRRLITPRGALIDDADYGYDLRALLNAGFTDRELAGVAALVVAEARKDDRVREASAEITYAPQTNTLRVVLMLTAEDPSIGTFQATFAVPSDGIALIESIHA